MEKLIATALAAIALTLAVVLLKAGVIAWNLWFLSARPALAARIYEAYTARPVKAFLIGSVNTALALFVVVVLLQIKPLGLIAILLFAGLCTAHLWGRTACYRVLAERLNVEPGLPPDTASWVRAAIITEAAFLVPLMGQLLYLGVTMRAAGAFCMAVLARGDGEAAGAVPEEPGTNP